MSAIMVPAVITEPLPRLAIHLAASRERPLSTTRSQQEPRPGAAAAATTQHAVATFAKLS